MATLHNHPALSSAAPLTRRQWLIVLSQATVMPATLAQPHASQEAWPAQPLKLIVAYPPGGISDVVARTLAEQLAIRLKVPVVVENKAGASGTLGVQAVARAAPDGYTLGFSAISPLTLSPHLSASPFDPLKELAPVASVMYSPVLILATSAARETDLQALLASARARPGSVRWATSGTASLGHIMLEQIRAAAKVDITHIPYKGGGPQITDALSGQFEVLSVNTSAAVLGHIQAGKLRPLAVGAPARLSRLPSVPTLAELGLPLANLSSHFGVLAPAQTPAWIRERLNQELNAVLAQPAIRERLLAAECVPAPSTPSEFWRLITAESDAMARVIGQARIQAN